MCERKQTEPSVLVIPALVRQRQEDPGAPWLTSITYSMSFRSDSPCLKKQCEWHLRCYPQVLPSHAYMHTCIHAQLYTFDHIYLCMHTFTHTYKTQVSKSADILNIEVHCGSVSVNTEEGKTKLKLKCHYLATTNEVMDSPLLIPQTDCPIHEPPEREQHTILTN